MICEECQTEPLTPGHYCECCGRKLSLQERQGKDAAPAAARCQSCGGASSDGDLCTSCRQAYAPVLGTTVTERSNEATTASAPKAPTVIPTTTIKLAAPAAPVVEAITNEAFRPNTAKTVADQTAKAHLAKAANPPPIARRPIAPPPPIPQRRSRASMLATAALVVVAIGAAEGARRLGYFHWPADAAPEELPVQTLAVAQNAPAVDRRPTADPPPAAKAESTNRAPAPAPLKPAVRPKSKPPDDRRAGTPARVAAQPAAAAASDAVPETPAPAPGRAPAPAAADSRNEPAQPTGRFFERSDVDEPPQIATRIEPQLPANLPARAQNDVVVVRVLVSQTGHPFRVSLLRGSRLGRTADEAIVAAVTRWTFSPARKRGEPVHCWYNIGVPLGQAN